MLLRSPEMYDAFVDSLEWVTRDGMTTAAVADISVKQLQNMFGVVPARCCPPRLSSNAFKRSFFFLNDIL